MTVDEARSLAIGAGYTWTVAGPCYYRVNRAPGQYGYAFEDEIQKLLPHQFLPFVEGQMRCE
jgi:hypothetical protein